MALARSGTVRRAHYALNATRAYVVNLRDRWRDPSAAQFFRALVEGGYDPDAHIDVLPQHRLIYVCVPKSASTTIKAALSSLVGRSVPAHRLHARRHTGLAAPRHVGISKFHRLVTCPSTLCFSFVRNPYARLVSAWADKFRGKPLVPGDAFVDQYLAYRCRTGAPAVAHGDTLPFADFVDFACATAHKRLNAHWATQHDVLSMPGIKLDFIGKVETFGRDFSRVLDHVDPHGRLAPALRARHNASRHSDWRQYYNGALAGRVSRAYACDFDRFGYTRVFD